MDFEKRGFIEYLKLNYPNNWENVLQLYETQYKKLNDENPFFKMAFNIANSAFNMPDIKPLSDEELNS